MNGAVIEYLRGTVVDKDGTSAVICCSGVGYGVSMPVPCLPHLPEAGEQEVSIWVHTHMTADRTRLFGFLELEQKHLFRQLIQINGVGPRTALAILSSLEHSALRQIVGEQDIASMAKVPGIGKKTAERILLELRDKLEFKQSMPTASLGNQRLRRDFISALLDLGFKGAAAEKTAEAVLESEPEQQDLAMLVREALRRSTQR